MASNDLAAGRLRQVVLMGAAVVLAAGALQGVSAAATAVGSSPSEGTVTTTARADDPPGPVAHRVLPTDHRDNSGGVGLTGFWWSLTGYPEIGQSVVIDEAFALTGVGFAMFRASTLEGWETADEQDISFGHETRWSGSIPAAEVRVSVWRAPEGVELDEEVDVSGFEELLVDEDTMDLTINATAPTSTARKAATAWTEASTSRSTFPKHAATTSDRPATTRKAVPTTESPHQTASHRRPTTAVSSR